jgi:predicted 2-oxoglutarate/Fe(II)-dependent dioxygenase YbiX
MVNVPTDTRYYIKVFDNVFEKKFCKKLIKQLNSSDASWSKHIWNTGYDTTGQDLYRQGDDKELSITKMNTPEALQLANEIWTVLQKYYGSVLTYHTWYHAWQGYTFPRFNKYEVNNEMKLHCDHITSIFEGTRRGIPVLTVLGALNDNYEGGNLIVGNEEVILKTGSVVVFPSVFIYPHEVKLVTKGTRYSFVSWVW